MKNSIVVYNCEIFTIVIFKDLIMSLRIVLPNSSIPKIFKFCTISIALSTLFVTLGEKYLITRCKFEDNLYDAMSYYFILFKMMINVSLSIICITCRTRFDLLVITAIADRIIASYMFMSIVIVFIKMTILCELNQKIQDIISIEMYLLVIVATLSIPSYFTYVEHNTKSLFFNKKE